MATRKRTKKAASTKKAAGPKMSPELKAAYDELQGNVKSLGKLIGEVRHGLRNAERAIQADARARIKALREEARTHLKALESQRGEVSRTLGRLRRAAEGSWADLRQSAETAVATARTTAATGARTILRLVDAQRATAHREAVQRLHRALRIGLRHLDEAEAPRTAGLAIGRERHRLNRAVLGEELANRGFVSRERQVAHIDLGHSNILRKLLTPHAIPERKSQRHHHTTGGFVAEVV